MALLQMLNISVRRLSLLFFVILFHHVTSKFLSKYYTARSGLPISAPLVSGHVTTEIHCAQWCLSIKPCTSFDHVIPLCRLYREFEGKGGNSGSEKMYYVEVFGKHKEIGSESADAVIICRTSNVKFGYISPKNNSFLKYSTVNVPRVENLVFSSKLNMFFAKTKQSIVMFSDPRTCCNKTFPIVSRSSRTMNFAVDGMKGLIFVPLYSKMTVINVASGDQHQKNSHGSTTVNGLAVDSKLNRLIVCQEKHIDLFSYNWKRKSRLHKIEHVMSCRLDTKTRTLYMFLKSKMMHKLDLESKRASKVGKLPKPYTSFVVFDHKIFFLILPDVGYMDMRDPKNIKSISMKANTWLCLKTED